MREAAGQHRVCLDHDALVANRHPVEGLQGLKR